MPFVVVVALMRCINLGLCQGLRYSSSGPYGLMDAVPQVLDAQSQKTQVLSINKKTISVCVSLCYWQSCALRLQHTE